MHIEHIQDVLEEFETIRAKVVHIAGSKGKGTTAHILAELLINKQNKVGLFSSPYISDESEMIQINGEKISSEELSELRNIYRAKEPKLTPFELLFLAGIHYFQEEDCDYIILECGWGGARDATNALADKDLCILTHVEAEHLGVLGDNIEEILEEKLGICRAGVPLLSAIQKDNSLQNIIINKSVNLNFPLRFVEELDIGEHHPACVGLAIAALQHFGLTLMPEDYKSIEALRISGRFEIVQFGPHTLILDGAHTYDSLADLEAHVQHYAYENNLGEPKWALHFLSDKNPKLYEIFQAENSVWVPLDEERAGKNHGDLSVKNLEEVFEELRNKPEPSCLVMTGSFRLIAKAYSLLS